MMLLHSKLARESCALKNETLPHALQGGGRYPTSGQFAT